MTLVREVCDYVYVLEFGQLIFEGTAEQMQNSAEVRSAYLGDFESAAGDENAEAEALSPSVTGE